MEIDTDIPFGPVIGIDILMCQVPRTEVADFMNHKSSPHRECDKWRDRGLTHDNMQKRQSDDAISECHLWNA